MQQTLVSPSAVPNQSKYLVSLLMTYYFPVQILHRVSVCKISDEDCKFLIETLKGIEFEIRLAYRGSLHGF